MSITDGVIFFVEDSPDGGSVFADDGSSNISTSESGLPNIGVAKHDGLKLEITWSYK